ncbi:MAG TPA: metallophosphoesterase [Acidimicrobiales bacterium]|nr:metallophosphoesterase [Acidimicrobiales bacterium]
MAHHLLIQLSDVHLTRRGELAPGIDPAANLASALALLEDEDVAADVILLTGDLTNEGDEPSYRDLAAALASSRAAATATVVYVPGNHDRRGPFRSVLLGQAPDEGPINQVAWHGGLRLVALDSTVPGEDHGSLDAGTLDFLADALAEPAPEGSIVVLHHPPSPSPIEMMAALRLANADDLGRAIEGTDVRAVLCGHYHHAGASHLGAVPVWTGPATSFVADAASAGDLRILPGGAMTRIDVDDDGVVTSVIPIGPGRPAPGARGPVRPG